MLWVKALALFIAGGSSIVIALLVLLRGSRQLNNLSFSALALSMAGWAIGIAFFFVSEQQEAAIWWAKVFYFFPLLIAVSLFIFVRTFPDDQRIPRGLLFAVLGGFLLIATLLTTVPEFLIQGVTYHDWGKEVILSDTGYLVYSLYVLPCYTLSLLYFYIKNRGGRGLYASQARLFSIGFFTAFVFGVTFNLFLPWLGNYQLIWIGPLFTSAFAVVIAYSIIKHKMFDVNLVVARSLAYALSLLTLASVYGLVVFGLAGYVLELHFSTTSQLIISATTGVAALSFGYLKRTFDKITNKLFYRDAYDPQEFFGEFNRALVSTVSLDNLVHEASQTISKYLKSQYCVIGVKQGSGRGYRILGTAEKTFSDDILAARRTTPYIHKAIIITDDLPMEHDRLKHVLQRDDIAILVQLTPDLHDVQEGLGYIVLGIKKSGNPYSNQDIRVLEAAANELVVAIQNALRFEEIENFSATLQHKVDNATKQLRHANEKLRILDQTKDDFVSMASHQLRTPLTSIKGYISMVLDGDFGKLNDTQRKMLEQVFVSSQRMTFLVADLLNLSRLRTGKFVIEPTSTNLSSMVDQEMAQLHEHAKSRNLKLDFKKPESFPDVMLDEAKTRQVVMNFLDNAIYYTPAGGTITIELKETPKMIEFMVHDTGIGVPKAEQPHLFTKFYRAPNAKKARPDGTGLGLFMAKKAVIAQGGAIIFRSEPGKGSTFGFSFPKHTIKTSDIA